MIEKYEIKKYNKQEILCVYISIDYEFSIQDFNNKVKDIELYVRDFIKKNKIVFRGNIVNIIVGGFLIGNIILSEYPLKSSTYNITPIPKYVSGEVINKTVDTRAIEKVIELKKEDDKQKKEQKDNSTKKNEKNKNSKIVNTTKKTTKNNKQNTTKKNIVANTNSSKKTTKKSDSTNKTVDNNIYISLNRNGKIQKIELEEYIIGVVGAEMPAAFHVEALKSQAIISRTYALKATSKGKTLSDNESSQSYKSNEELKKMWGSNYNTYYNKIKKAVNETKGMYLSYKGQYIEAVFHSTSNGKTESSVNVWGNSYPYLVSVSSKYDNLNSSFIKTKKVTYNELSKKLEFTVNNETEFTIISKTSGDRVNKISIDNKTYTGVKLRNLLGLRSTDFSVEKVDDGVVFTTRGYGHGVGLSQYGANGYAKNGMNYQKILLHYYPGVSLNHV